MKVTKVAASYGESIAHPLQKIKPALFSHSQIRPSCFMEADLEDGEVAQEVYEQLQACCIKNVRTQIAAAFNDAKEEKENGSS